MFSFHRQNVVATTIHTKIIEYLITQVDYFFPGGKHNVYFMYLYFLLIIIQMFSIQLFIWKLSFYFAKRSIIRWKALIFSSLSFKYYKCKVFTEVKLLQNLIDLIISYFKIFPPILYLKSWINWVTLEIFIYFQFPASWSK